MSSEYTRMALIEVREELAALEEELVTARGNARHYATEFCKMKDEAEFAWIAAWSERWFCQLLLFAERNSVDRDCLAMKKHRDNALLEANELKRELAAAKRLLREQVDYLRRRMDGTTHWHGCEKDHAHCRWLRDAEVLVGEQAATDEERRRHAQDMGRFIQENRHNAEAELAVAKSRINELISLASVSIAADDVCLMEAWVAAWDECWRKQWLEAYIDRHGAWYDCEFDETLLYVPGNENLLQWIEEAYNSAHIESPNIEFWDEE